MGVKGIIFDLDNTLYDERKYYRNAIKEFAYRFSLDEKKLMNALYMVYPKGGDVLGNILIASGYPVSLQQKFFEIYTSVTSKINISFKVKDILSKLKTRFKLFILTNGNVKAQKNKIKVLSIQQFFDDIIYAREFPCEKPDCVSLKYLLSKWKIEPEEVIVIGDDEFTDGGLQNCGVRVFIIKEFYKYPEKIWEILKLSSRNKNDY
jgi:putative hydrolase of the HAD superfamily